MEPPAPDPDPLKDLPDIPPPAVKKSRLVMSLQFFAVPAIIASICIGIYLLAVFMTAETQNLGEIFQRFKTSHGHQKAVYAEMFVRMIRQGRKDFTRPASQEMVDLTRTIVTYLRELSKKKDLSPEEGYDKRLCIQALGLIGHRGAAEVVAEILQVESQEEILWDCLNTLGLLKEETTLAAILPFLKHSSYQVRKFAVFAVGEIGGASVVDALRERLQDTSEEVRWNAAFALGFFQKDRSGVPILLKMLDLNHLDSVINSQTPDGRFYRAHAVALAARALGVLREKSALELLKKHAADYPDSETRRHCREAVEAIEKGP